MLEAANLPGAEVFVLPDVGELGAVFVLAPDRFVWCVLTPGGFDFVQSLDPKPGGYFELEHQLAILCDWVPRSLRALALGLVNPSDLDLPRH